MRGANLANGQEPVERIAFMLVRDGHVLAEKRSPARRVVPGVIALPGGHMDASETPLDAARREMLEELDVKPLEIAYVCTLLHTSQEFRKLHDFAVTSWTGDITPRVAESVRWIPLDTLQGLDLGVDRVAVS